MACDGGARPHWRAAVVAEERQHKARRCPSLWGSCNGAIAPATSLWQPRLRLRTASNLRMCRSDPSLCCRCTPINRTPSRDAFAEVRPGAHELASPTTACTSAPKAPGPPPGPPVSKATAASPLLARHNMHRRRRHASQPARPAAFIPTLPIRARAARAHSAPSPRPDAIGATTVQRPARGPPHTTTHGKGTSLEKEARRDSRTAETKAP